MDKSEVLSVEAIRAALIGRYPADQYVHIPEAPEKCDRSGRRLDVLIVDCWNSRGLARIGVEIKRSIADFRNELKDPYKADWWAERTNEFWIAAPALVARRIELSGQLPLAWGLLSISDTGRCRASSPAQRRQDPTDLDWTTIVGVLRAASGMSLAILDRHRQQGYDAAMADAAALAIARPNV